MKAEELKSAIKPKQLISVEKAKELNGNYNSKRADLHSKAIGKEDANAIWYSLEELENYIEYVKSEGEQQGYAVDGIRFYLGVYSEVEGKGKSGYTTIFLSPTGKCNDENQLAKSLIEGEEGEGEGECPEDIITIEPLNFGSMGNPPKMQYGG
ncbi:hypothetical protein [Flavobacterium sp.]|uniref:hypothetical protein n=1 Tax=Flavobacterium sp. TaxID=239 RepID=UPI00262EC6E4|nr:hypothetical protein [Flavobacterium sp.]